MPGTFTFTVATQTVQVTGGTSGSPADFASFITADRAGTATDLLAATAGLSNPDNTLTDQVRPVEDLAIIIKCIVASKTAEADFIFITGTDFTGAAQTESLDVTAGNGTYTTTKRWATITGLDCSDNSAGGGTVWADGTIQVTQDIWGIISDFGLNQLQIEGRFVIGDGSTATVFADTDKMISFPDGHATGDNFLWIDVNVATLQLGTLLSAANKTTSRGCHLLIQDTNHDKADIIRSGNSSNTILLYSSIFSNIGTAGSPQSDVRINACASGSRLWNCMFLNRVNLDSPAANLDVSRLTSSNPRYGALDPNAAIDDFQIMGPATGINIESLTDVDASSLLVFDASYEDIYSYNYQGTADLTDSLIGANVVKWAGATRTGEVNENYTVNIHVADIDGTNLQSVTVLCENEDGTQAFSVSTAANGTITEQTVRFKRNFFDGSPQVTTFSPHKFTITKAGFEPVIIENIELDLNTPLGIDWEIVLKTPVGAIDQPWR